MQLDVRGRPIHTRALSVTLRQRQDGRLDVHGSILDLRKRGIVPVVSDLQGPGVIHHMLIDAVVEPSSRRIEEISTRQPAVAFEPSAVSGGESCRDPAARLEILRGSTIDAGYSRRLSDAIGGPRGCSHVLTLAQLLGPTVRWALDHDAGGERQPGERLFRRDLVLDGHEPEAKRVDIAIQLNDFAFAAAPAVAQPMSRFGAHLEVLALAQVDLTQLVLAGLVVGQRRRGRDDVDRDEWQRRSEIEASLVGQPALVGITPILLDRLAADPQSAPVYDALLMLAPTMIQCFATMSDSWLGGTRDADTLIGMGGIPDSCYMWRRDGALHQARRPGDPVPTLGPRPRRQS
jgi:hypothetical protein